MNNEQDEDSHARLQERLLAAILAFPARLDVMETRDEETCRKLASRLAELAEKEFEMRLGRVATSEQAASHTQRLGST